MLGRQRSGLEAGRFRAGVGSSVVRSWIAVAAGFGVPDSRTAEVALQVAAHGLAVLFISS